MDAVGSDKKKMKTGGKPKQTDALKQQSAGTEGAYSDFEEEYEEDEGE